MTAHTKPIGSAPYPSIVDVLDNAGISDKQAVMNLERLAPDVQRQIVRLRNEGFHIASVRWATGEFAIVPCPPGTDVPRPAQIIRVRPGCRQTKNAFPEGAVPCLLTN